MSRIRQALVGASFILWLVLHPPVEAQDAVEHPILQERLLLRLNLPSLTLELYRGAELIRKYPVAIGDTAYPTPEGTFEVTHVDWDPW
jgi:L,D-transpeptidase catalytic domain